MLLRVAVSLSSGKPCPCFPELWVSDAHPSPEVDRCWCHGSSSRRQQSGVNVFTLLWHAWSGCCPRETMPSESGATQVCQRKAFFPDECRFNVQGYKLLAGRRGKGLIYAVCGHQNISGSALDHWLGGNRSPCVPVLWQVTCPLWMRGSLSRK